MIPLRAALRNATSAAHTTLEASMDLHPASINRDRYGRALQVLHAVRTGWQPVLATFLPAEQGPHIAWLEADLHLLELDFLPPAPPPPVASELQAWGTAYVLEGSALGGLSLLPALARLGLTPEHGARYFAGRGSQTGAHWAAFLERLNAQATPATTQSIIDAAQIAFEAMDHAARQHRQDTQAVEG